MSIVFVGFTWDVATKKCNFISENRCLTGIMVIQPFKMEVQEKYYSKPHVKIGVWFSIPFKQ
jgi:hypothetical protein